MSSFCALGAGVRIVANLDAIDYVFRNCALLAKLDFINKISFFAKQTLGEGRRWVVLLAVVDTLNFGAVARRSQIISLLTFFALVHRSVFYTVRNRALGKFDALIEDFVVVKSVDAFDAVFVLVQILAVAHWPKLTNEFRYPLGLAVPHEPGLLLMLQIQVVINFVAAGTLIALYVGKGLAMMREVREDALALVDTRQIACLADLALTVVSVAGALVDLVRRPQAFFAAPVIARSALQTHAILTIDLAVAVGNILR